VIPANKNNISAKKYPSGDINKIKIKDAKKILERVSMLIKIDTIRVFL
jgi:hypothetical protein